MTPVRLRSLEPWCAPARVVPLVALLLSGGLGGCISPHYAVSRQEMERLVNTPPAERGQDIHAVQRLFTDDDPEPASVWEPEPGPPPPGMVFTRRGYEVPSFYIESYGTPSYEPPVYEPPRLASEAGGVHGASPVNGPHGTSSHASGSSSGSSSGSLGNIQGMDKLLAAAVVVGVVVGVALAVTEGLRYEGAVVVHPHHPVHLWLANGQQSTVALDELTREHLRTATEFILSGEEGAGMWLPRASPLNRVGFSYQLGMGDDGLALPRGQSVRGMGFRFALGYYPHQTFGLLADTRLQFDDGPGYGYNNTRLGLEAQWYPLHWWRLHLGGFVGGGRAWSSTAGEGLPTTRVERPYVAFGGLAELELATRLGLTARWTQDWMPTSNPDTRGFIGSWSLGLAIY